MADLVAQTWDLLTSERFYIYRNIAAVVGTLYLLKKAISFTVTLWGIEKAYFLAPWGIFRTNLKKYGPWAVVTGASDGIGKGYALELARRGLNVVIISRSEEKLQKVADEIREKYGREVRVIAVDFSKGQEIYPQLEEKLRDLDIGVLVNNVGMASEYPDYFLNVSQSRYRKMLELNCQTMVQMTHLLLPKMVEKKGGVVINISSGASVTITPLLAVYSASKAFVSYFSAALDAEYRSKGIIVQNVKPWGVATEASKVPESFFTPSPSSFTRAAVSTVGLLSPAHGYFPHVLQGLVIENLPQFLQRRVMWAVVTSVRENALREKAKQKRGIEHLTLCATDDFK